MYEIYAEYINEDNTNDVIQQLLYSPQKSLEGYEIISGSLTEEVNKAGKLEFKLPKTNPNIQYTKPMYTTIVLVEDGAQIWRGRVLSTETDFYGNKTVTCEGALAFFNDILIMLGSLNATKPNLSGTTKTILSKILNAYKKTMDEMFGAAGSAKKLRYIDVIRIGDPDEYSFNSYTISDYMTVYDALTKYVFNIDGRIARISYNGYYDTPGRTDIQMEIDNEFVNSTQSIQFGVNLLDLIKYEDGSDMISAIIPYGAEQSDGTRVDISSVMPNGQIIFGFTKENLIGRIMKVVYFDDIYYPDELLLKTVTYKLNDVDISFEASALDLKILGVDASRIQAGDTIPVVSTPHGVNMNIICSSITRNLLDPSKDEYSFGTKSPVLTDKV